MLPGSGRSDTVGTSLVHWVSGWFLRADVNTHALPLLGFGTAWGGFKHSAGVRCNRQRDSDLTGTGWGLAVLKV